MRTDGSNRHIGHDNKPSGNCCPPHGNWPNTIISRSGGKEERSGRSVKRRTHLKTPGSMLRIHSFFSREPPAPRVPNPGSSGFELLVKVPVLWLPPSCSFLLKVLILFVDQGFIYMQIFSPPPGYGIFRNIIKVQPVNHKRIKQNLIESYNRTALFHKKPPSLPQKIIGKKGMKRN